MTDTAKDQALAQFQSIAAMIAAVNVDYDRLQELRDERESYEADRNDTDNGHMLPTWAAQYPEDAEELAELEAAAGDCEDEDDARQRISEDPLSVEVRSDWASPGEELTAGEFKILLCTGGPAVQIRGELDSYGQPCRAWIEYQDWGTPWTDLYIEGGQRTLIEYASYFFA